MRNDRLGQNLAKLRPAVSATFCLVGLALVLAISIAPRAWNGGNQAVASEGSDAAPDSPRAGAVLDHLRRQLDGRDTLVWTGHLNPDTDSIAGSLLAAHIHGGVASTPAPLNPESLFALEQCDIEAPRFIEDYSQNEVALVDFNQETQLPPSIDPASIVAIIDHHALGASPVIVPQVLTIDIRPWGSVATILADQAETLSLDLPPQLACTAMAAILSDTVNLTLPTTTQYDRDYVERLAARAGVDDIDDFAEQMLLAKSDLSGLSAGEIVLLDYKDFEFGGKSVGIGVAETLTAQDLIDRRDELRAAIHQEKSNSGIDHLVFAIVDTRNQRSYLLWGDEADRALVTAAFGDDVSDDMVIADGVISRKQQIGPAVQETLESATHD